MLTGSRNSLCKQLQLGGPKWIPGVLKQLTSATSSVVQLEDGQLLRPPQDHLSHPSVEAKKPRLQVEETLTTRQDTPTPPMELVQSALQGFPKNCYPTGNRHVP